MLVVFFVSTIQGTSIIPSNNSLLLNRSIDKLINTSIILSPPFPKGLLRGMKKISKAYPYCIGVTVDYQHLFLTATDNWISFKDTRKLSKSILKLDEQFKKRDDFNKKHFSASK